MAKPVAFVLSSAAKDFFRRLNIVLPSQVSSSGSGSSSQWQSSGLSTAQIGVVAAGGISANRVSPQTPAMPPLLPPQARPPALFIAAPGPDGKSYAPDVDYQQFMSQAFNNFIDGICGAISFAWGTWMDDARLIDVQVRGPVAAFGKVIGPAWAPLIMQKAPQIGNLGWESRYSQAVANGLHNGWKGCQDTMSVLGVPWYPTFAVAVVSIGPISNIPTPFNTIVPSDLTLRPQWLVNEMSNKLGAPQAPYATELFRCLTFSFCQYFAAWMPTTMVCNVMGKGDVVRVLGGVGLSVPQPLQGTAKMEKTGFF